MIGATAVSAAAFMPVGAAVRAILVELDEVAVEAMGDALGPLLFVANCVTLPAVEVRGNCQISNITTEIPSISGVTTNRSFRSGLLNIRAMPDNTSAITNNASHTYAVE